MNAPCPSPRVISRRTFLRAAGVILSLPLLEAMAPFARASANAAPRRMVLFNKALGLYAADFFPEQAGRDYELTPYLQELAGFRNDFTVFSGLSHPEAGGGHSSEASFLTAAPRSGTLAFKNTISLDQLAAEHVGAATRYPFLALGTHVGSLSWTRNGVQIPSDKDPARVFRRLFIAGTPTEIAEQEQFLKDGHSVLDSVREEIDALQRQVGTHDREQLDQYFTAVREVEKRLHTAEAWSRKPKPQVAVPPLGPYPSAEDIVGRTQRMYDLIHLSLQTDSTRIVTLSIDVDGGVPPIKGVEDTRHNLSHHGMAPALIEQLRLVEREEVRCLGKLLEKLNVSQEGDSTLLDHTMVLYGSNLGNASSHDPRSLPILLAGGGFKHGQHLAFDRQHNSPLANVFVSMLQRFGLETDRFGSSTGTIRGLETA